MGCLEELFTFFRMFFHIKWTTTTLVICSLPFTLMFVIINLTVLIIDGSEGAIITRSRSCAQIGREIFSEGGSAADVVIAVMFCENVHLPLKVGIGGGFTAIMLMNGRFNSIVATPKQPSNVPDIYNKDNLLGSQTGGVPGELLGYWEMHQKYGLLPWKRLLEPTIKLCNETTPVNENTLHNYQKILNESLTSDLLTHILSEDRNETALRMPVFVTTLQKIADKGSDVFYHGELGKAFIEDLQAAGGYMTFDDLENYRVSWNRELVTFTLPRGLKGYTTPLPSSGVVVALVMNIIKSYEDMHLPVFWHRVVEAMKHASGISRGLGDLENENVKKYADMIRKTYQNMMDPLFARSIRDKIFDNQIFNDSSYYGVKYQSKYNGGSVQLCVIAPNGDTISLTSSLLWPVTSFFWSSRTGIILNNQVHHFHFSYDHKPLPPGAYLTPGKRSVNSHAPVIIVNARTKKPFFVVSASGGGYIPYQIITTLIKFCLLRTSAYKAINSGFLRPRLDYNFVEYYDEISDEVLKYLKEVGNKLINFEKDLLYCSVSGIATTYALPEARISRRNAENGSAFLEGEGNIFYVIIILFACSAVIFVVIFDYILLIQNSKPLEID